MKLLTKAIERQLLAAPALNEKLGVGNQESAKIVVKFFTPDAQCSWFIIDGEKQPDGDWRLFGFCSLGDRDLAELGYVMLSELQAIRGKLGLPVERDMWYEGTLADARKEVGRS